MANTSEIKNRINSIKDTQKITEAMYLIASTKMRKAKNDLDKTRPYFTSLKNEIKRIFRTVENVDSKYFYPKDLKEIKDDGTWGILVISSDKGLAGAYNQNVIKETLRLLKEHHDSKLFVVGQYGRHYFERHNIPIEKSFLYTAQNPTINRAREISNMMLDMFNNGQLDRIFVVYTDMKNELNEEATSTRLIPFHRSYFIMKDEKPIKTSFEFRPDINKILDNAIPSYVTGFIYSALVDSFCSEQNARMVAMNNANDNANKILNELSGEYNRIRQAQITQEITEVSAGAKALRNRRKKEARV